MEVGVQSHKGMIIVIAYKMYVGYYCFAEPHTI